MRQFVLSVVAKPGVHRREQAVDLTLARSVSFEVAYFWLTIVSGNKTTAKNTNPKRQRGKHFTRKGRRNLFASLAVRVNIRTVCATSKSVSEGYLAKNAGNFIPH